MEHFSVSEAFKGCYTFHGCFSAAFLSQLQHSVLNIQVGYCLEYSLVLNFSVPKRQMLVAEPPINHFGDTLVIMDVHVAEVW